MARDLGAPSLSEEALQRWKKKGNGDEVVSHGDADGKGCHGSARSYWVAFFRVRNKRILVAAERGCQTGIRLGDRSDYVD